MPSPYITPQGLRIKRLADMLADAEARLRQPAPVGWGPQASLEADTLVGQLAGALFPEVAEVWTALAELDADLDPDHAAGARLERWASAVGVFRKGALPASGQVTLHGLPGTTVPGRDTGAPKRVRAGTQGPVFELRYSATLATIVDSGLDDDVVAGASEIVVNSHSDLFAVGQWVTVGSGVDAEVHRVAATNDAQLTLTTPLLRSWSAGASVRVAQATVAVEALVAGAIPTVEVGAVDTIVTPVAGWVAVHNPAPFHRGADMEPDDQLALRRRLALPGGNTATDDAIANAVRHIDGVSAVRCISNRTLATGGEGHPGQPGKSFYVVVEPAGLTAAQADAIARAVYPHMPAGIQMWAPDDPPAVSRIVSDSGNYPRTVVWGPGVPVALYVQVLKTYADGVDTSALDAAVKAAVLSAVGEVLLGGTVFRLRILADLYALGGVRNAEVRMATGSEPSWSSAHEVNISAQPWEVISLDEAHITIGDL